MTYSHAFSRAWHGRHVFASSSDWFIGLFTTVVIGQSNYFGFGFTTLNENRSNKAEPMRNEYMSVLSLFKVVYLSKTYKLERK